jgi:hypothetical protein
MTTSQSIGMSESPASESRRAASADELTDPQWLDGLLERVDEQGAHPP